MLRGFSFLGNLAHSSHHFQKQTNSCFSEKQERFIFLRAVATCSQYTSMTNKFSIFDEGSPVLTGETAASGRKSRPVSAGGRKGGNGSKRPQSAGGNGKESVGLQIAKQNTKNAARAAALRAFYGEDQQPLTRGTWQDMSREELLVEVKELKQKNSLLEQQSHSLRMENQRLDAESSKLQQKLERMLVTQKEATTVAGSPGGQAESMGSKRELEKSLLVRHLKHQIISLRETVAEKAQELEAYKRTTKASNINELLVEREEYLLESKRLRAALRESRLPDGESPNSRAFNEKVNRALVNEVQRLASGYEDVLRGMRSAVPGLVVDAAISQAPSQLVPVVREPVQAAQTMTSAPVAAPTGNSAAAGRPRPQLEVVMPSALTPTSKNSQTASVVAPTAHRAAPAVGSQTPVLDANLKPSAETLSVIPTKDLTEVAKAGLLPKEMSKTMGAVAVVASVGHVTPQVPVSMSVTGSKQSDEPKGKQLFNPKAASIAPSKEPLRVANVAVTPVPAHLPSGPEDAPSSSPCKLNERVEALYRNGKTWYCGTIIKLSEDGLIARIRYDDGEEEKGVPVSRIRKLAGVDSSPPVQAAKHVPPISSVAPSASPTTSSKKMLNSTTAMSRPQACPDNAQFVVGDAVEARYFNGKTWYRATVEKVNRVAGTTPSVWMYDLVYADGDREKKVDESKIRPASIVTPTSSPFQQTKKWPDMANGENKPLTPQNKEDARVDMSSKKRAQSPGREVSKDLAFVPTKHVGGNWVAGSEQNTVVAEVANQLRMRTKDILSNEDEYARAFASMSGVSDVLDLNVDTVASEASFQLFAQDVLGQKLTKDMVSVLYAHIGLDSGSKLNMFTLQRFVAFLQNKVEVSTDVRGTQPNITGAHLPLQSALTQPRVQPAPSAVVSSEMNGNIVVQPLQRMSSLDLEDDDAVATSFEGAVSSDMALGPFTGLGPVEDVPEVDFNAPLESDDEGDIAHGSRLKVPTYQEPPSIPVSARSVATRQSDHYGSDFDE